MLKNGILKTEKTHRFIGCKQEGKAIMGNIDSVARDNEYILNIGNCILKMSVTREEIIPDLSGFLHSHGYCELFSCLSGEINIESTDGVTVLSDGDIAIVPAGIKHVKRNGTDTEADFRVISFSADKKTSGTPNYFGVISGIVSSKHIIYIHNQMELCTRISEICRRAIDGEIIGTSVKFADVIAEISEKAHSKNKIVEKKRNYGSNMHVTRVVDQLLDTHYKNNLTVKGIAEMLYISERQLTRIILARYGKHFSELLRDRRLEVATELLKTTTAPAYTVGFESGFDNQESFYRSFKKKYGMTAMQYRKMFKSE